MSHDTFVQPKLADLLAGFLEKQADAHAAGIATFDHEVTPYEVGPVQPLDPKLAWDEGLVAVGVERQHAPPHWSALVANHESTVAIAFCAGNFPQLMRSFHTLLTEQNLTRLGTEAGRPANAPELAEWTAKIARHGRFPQMLLAIGVLRLARHFAEAEAFVQTHDANVPAEWRAAWENEKAALAWHAGRHAEARKMWDALEPTVPVLFNRGMAALFLDRPAEARSALGLAIGQLPETGAWHHLGRLYLALAEMRG